MKDPWKVRKEGSLGRVAMLSQKMRNQICISPLGNKKNPYTITGHSVEYWLSITLHNLLCILLIDDYNL